MHFAIWTVTSIIFAYKYISENDARARAKGNRSLQSSERGGIQQNVCCGIMRNISVETRGSFDYQQKQPGGGPGRGLFQM